MPRPRPYSGMVHLNGNLLCAIDVETTGIDPEKHDIIEICVLPLDRDYRPQRGIIPFNMTMKPARPENVDLDALNVNRQKYADILTNSLDPYRTSELFMEWFERLNLGTNKRVSPLAHNWVFDREFIRNWLGALSYELVFDGRYRDTMVVANFLNDRSEMKSERIPLPKVNLTYLASIFKIDHSDAHNALPDCRITAELYAELVRQSL